MAAAGQAPVAVYPVGNYNFGVKGEKVEKDASVQDHLARMQTQYKQQGLRTTVEAILLVHEHEHPHILLLQYSGALYKLPGGRLRPGEDETEGLKRKLTNLLSPTAQSLATEWLVGQCAAVYWRPNFEPTLYPYLPVHITRPKEVKKLYAIHLPEKCFFAVPKNMKLVAVPFYELYNSASRYGPVIAALPQILSRFRLTFVGGERQLALRLTSSKQEDEKDEENIYGADVS